MENLNAEQIKKALEHCIKDSTCEQCPQSPFTCHIQEDALSLIKKLTEENERLRADKDYWKKRAKESESEYDQAVKRGYNIGAIDHVGSFAERLKALIKSDYINGTREQAMLAIDQIANELLTEDSK